MIRSKGQIHEDDAVSMLRTRHFLRYAVALLIPGVLLFGAGVFVPVWVETIGGALLGAGYTQGYQDQATHVSQACTVKVVERTGSVRSPTGPRRRA